MNRLTGAPRNFPYHDSANARRLLGPLCRALASCPFLIPLITDIPSSARLVSVKWEVAN